MSRPMKDSGVKWIGDIPANWKINTAKRIFRKEKRPIVKDEIVTAFRDGEVTQRKNRRTSGFTMADKEIGYQGVEPGDLVIHAMDAFAGAIGVSDSQGKCSPVCSICTPITEVDTYYYSYLLRAYSFLGYIESMAKGIRERSTDFRYTTFAITPLIQPPLEEQKKITTFIEEKASHIDSIISQTKESIEAFKAYKKALVMETVTKGLDAKVKLKDSGIGWIGDIPEHWRGTKIRNLCYLQSGKNLTSEEIEPEGLFPVYGGNGIRGYYHTFNRDGYHILIGRQGALCGNINLARGKFWATEHAIVVENKGFTDVTYFSYLLQSMNLNQYSQTAAQPGLAVGQINNLKTILPPVIEQQQIADFLDQKTAHIDSLIADKEKMVRELQEYKKSLIYEYVTGKKEV